MAATPTAPPADPATYCYTGSTALPTAPLSLPPVPTHTLLQDPPRVVRAGIKSEVKKANAFSIEIRQEFLLGR
jgi:hypothetical protein